jgi:hypothetical protein
LRDKIQKIRQKLARNPKSYEEDIVRIVNDTGCKRWNEQSKTEFSDAL